MFSTALRTGLRAQRRPLLVTRRMYASLDVNTDHIPFCERKVSDVLNLNDMASKIGSWTIDSEATVFDATKKMVDNRSGSLCVTNGGGKVIGIITERDYLTKVLHSGRRSKTTKVKEIATLGDELIIATPDEYLQECVDTMVYKNIRHLPVSEPDGTVVGMLDIQDIAKALADERVVTLHTLAELRIQHQMPIHDG